MSQTVGDNDEQNDAATPTKLTQAFPQVSPQVSPQASPGTDEVGPIQEEMGSLDINTPSKDDKTADDMPPSAVEDTTDAGSRMRSSLRKAVFKPLQSIRKKFQKKQKRESVIDRFTEGSTPQEEKVKYGPTAEQMETVPITTSQEAARPD